MLLSSDLLTMIIISLENLGIKEHVRGGGGKRGLLGDFSDDGDESQGGRREVWVEGFDGDGEGHAKSCGG